jgi:two-component system, chemotaxis family, protein-glutamate methylesterase/glutaminase
MNKIKVLIIEDSAVTRQVLSKIISEDHDLVVVDTAIDPFIALRKIEKYRPDVITLDLELPRMDGLTFLKQLMMDNPIPVVIISSVTEKGSRNAIKALELGAVEVISKPDVSSPEKLVAVTQTIHESIKAAYNARVIKLKESSAFGTGTPIKFKLPSKSQIKKQSTSIIAIGASTGGTEALRQILTDVEVGIPGILIVQHMPESFTKSFAERLNSLCNIIVKEAEDHDEVMDGQALIAPGNKHMILTRYSGKYVVRLLDTEKVNRHRPSVDVLFRSVAREAGSRAQGILLTGMGEDGAAGLLEMKNAGAYTIAQDKETSVVYGMPKRAAELGAATDILPLHQISHLLNNTLIKSL